MNTRSEVIGMLSGEHFRMTTSEEMGRYVEELSQPEQFEA